MQTKRTKNVITTAIQAAEPAQLPSLSAATLELAVIGGDLSKLTPAQRLEYYGGVCQSMGLNPLTKPFMYVSLSGGLTLYATKNATDQLRNIHKVNMEIVSREVVGDVYVVTTRAFTPDGRSDEATGAVSIAGMRGEALANAYMKAETKSKRRVTLSLVGLSTLDESEVESIRDARYVQVDDRGEIVEDDTPTKAGKSRPAATKVAPADNTPLPAYTLRKVQLDETGLKERQKRLRQVAQENGLIDPTTDKTRPEVSATAKQLIGHCDLKWMLDEDFERVLAELPLVGQDLRAAAAAEAGHVDDDGVLDTTAETVQ
jgi:hypothetical protein